MCQPLSLFFNQIFFIYQIKSILQAFSRANLTHTVTNKQSSGFIDKYTGILNSFKNRHFPYFTALLVYIFKSSSYKLVDFFLFWFTIILYEYI